MYVIVVCVCDERVNKKSVSEKRIRADQQSRRDRSPKKHGYIQSTRVRGTLRYV